MNRYSSRTIQSKASVKIVKSPVFSRVFFSSFFRSAGKTIETRALKVPSTSDYRLDGRSLRSVSNIIEKTLLSTRVSCPKTVTIRSAPRKFVSRRDPGGRTASATTWYRGERTRRPQTPDVCPTRVAKRAVRRMSDDRAIIHTGDPTDLYIFVMTTITLS